MYYFGLISEGVTDNAVLVNILIGYFDQDISEYINHLQPPPKTSGGWSRVLKYCSSSDFKNDLAKNDFIVIQIDTDRSFELPFDVAHEQNGQKLSVEKMVENVKNRFEKLFLEAFGVDFLPKFGHRILFAIAVHSTECWLLPLHYKGLKDQLEIRHCYEKLNKKIVGLKKEYKIYNALSTDFCSPKKLEKAASANPSFKIFIENELKVKIPLNTEGS